MIETPWSDNYELGSQEDADICEVIRDYRDTLMLVGKGMQFSITIRNREVRIHSCESDLGEEVIIPEFVTYIGDSTFHMRTRVRKVHIPESVITIGYAAFSNCWALESLKIPESVLYIGTKMMYICTKVKELIIPDSVLVIGDGGF